MGGPTRGVNAPGPGKLRARKERKARLARIVDSIRPAWRERMKGVDQHGLRMTHRTWALAAGVPEILIDRQLGHSSRTGDAALNTVWSAVGRRHYTDMGFLTLDAARSAEAVRGLLDRAEAELESIVAQGGTMLASKQGLDAAPIVRAAAIS